MTGKRSATRQFSVLILASILAVGPGFADSLSPKDTYLQYRAALVKAAKIEDLQTMLCKKVNEDIAHTPPDMKPMMFDLMKATAPTSVQVVSEVVDGDNATLTLAGRTEPAGPSVSEQTSGKVRLVRESGIWKILKESWNSKIEVGGKDQPLTK